MKKPVYILILTALAATSFASKVTNVELAFTNGETVARIDVSGQIRFTHQTEIPKNGKPDRLIVDVLTATHELGGKVFEDLPLCPVTAVRSSQYSVKPEAVVRIVFDMKKTPVYQVETMGQSIVVRIIDKTAAPFPTWATSQYLKATPTAAPITAALPKSETAKPIDSAATPAQKNASAEGDRQSSLATVPPKPVTTISALAPMADSGLVSAPKPATPAVAATPKTELKAADSKPSANSPAPSVTAIPKSELKPAETKPAVPVTATGQSAAPAVSAPTVNSSEPLTKPATPTTPSASESKSDVVWTPPSNSKPNTPAPAATTAVKTDSASSTLKTEFKPTDAKPAAGVAITPVTPVVNVSKQATSTPNALSPATPAVAPGSNKPTAPSPAPPAASAMTKPESAKASSPTTATVPDVASGKLLGITPPSPANPIPNAPNPTERPVPGSPLPSELAQKAKEPVQPIVRTEKPYTTDDDFMPEPEDLEPAEDNPYVDHDSPAGAQWADTHETVDSNSTARFRRHPLSAAKIKGTMIAQFPQRLVIKYQTGGTRDPFATLIDDSKTFNTPTKQGVPNVDGMRLVGVIVARQGGNRALFLDKNGYSYMLQSGDKVRNGYVLRIESGRAYFQIFEYGWSRTVALKIDES